jgi:2-succinyl-6-hydroxy-2,4-cyclohexadiene-1-carboxylate synthase
VADDLGQDHDLIALDAPGHGSAGHLRLDLPGAARRAASRGGRAVYIGYSMGARMAIHVALNHPDVVESLVLIGGTPGISDPGERAARQAQDHKLADHIRSIGVDAFLVEWLAQPLFAGLPDWARFDDERRRNTPEGLATSLELCGTGSQTSLWPRLQELSMPVLLVAGTQDSRYADIAHRMAPAIGPNASVALIPDAGHTAHLENPDAFLAAFRTWQQ